MGLSNFHPLVREWFVRRFGEPTEPQFLAWPEIQGGSDLLLSAPTGSGKTLAAFLSALDRIIRQASDGTLEDRTEVLYVSPLKALSNDVQKNLQGPLEEIAALAVEQGQPLAPIRVALRTGDTPASERREHSRHAPHILVTTPESLYILLTAERSRKMLASVRTLIVDEIHAVANNKRGSHLALSIARLEAIITGPMQKIGLSATVKPVEEVARFLSPKARIVNIGHRRAMEIAVEVPKDELGAVATNEQWAETYDRLAELVLENRTTLIFVNTRRLSERVAHHLGERLGGNAVLPHHGSLSRKLRLEAEQRLKNGDLRAVVATASLELGIDIGTVDLVCQVGSPRSIGVALQRIGRAGHWVGALPKGRLFATTRDELVECAAVVRAIRRGDLDRLAIPVAPLDILAQQLAAECACREWEESELFDLVRRALPYRNLSERDFNSILEMLSEGITTARGRRGALLHRDRVNHLVRGRRGARLTAITSGGAIPDTSQYQVIAEPEGTVVGSLDEDFAVESMAGDIFLLGTTSWRIRRVEPGRIRVEDAHGSAPSIPFWNGEAPGRTFELSREVSQLRQEISLEVLEQECGLDRAGAEQALAYVRAGARALGAMPSQDVVVAERFFDEAGGMQLVIHAPFGSRITKAWGLALRKRFCRTFNFELQAAATDNGLLLSLSDQHSFPLEVVFSFLNTKTVEHVLTQAMLPAPMFTARWRWNASRSLALPRFAGGRKVPPPVQRMRSDDLLAAVFPDQAACAENLTGEIRVPDHPLVNETIDNCLHEAMDFDGLKTLLGRLENGSLRAVAIDTAEPSPFSHEILNSNPYAYLDDAPLEERRARAVQLRRTLPPEDAASLGALDAAAIAQVAEESWPVVRDADELHDALLTLTLLPPQEEWREHFEHLLDARRATTLTTSGASFWVAAERLELALRAQPDARLIPSIESATDGRELPEAREDAIAAVLRGWMDSIGPTTVSAIATKLSFPLTEVEIALAKLESEGQILRGHFANAGEIEFCHRRIVARIHRMTLGRLRREIEPVTTANFIRFLTRWQHVAFGAQLHGANGLFQILGQLQGYEIPAAAWESVILPRRVRGYEPAMLDHLCLAGEIMWGRLSPHPAFESEGPRRVRPTRSAPIAIFFREDATELLREPAESPKFSHAAQEVLRAIEQRGASFFKELVRETNRLASEVEDGLWELVAAGLVTADGFDSLRSLVDPKRRRGEGRGREARPRHAAGRWALLRQEPRQGQEQDRSRQHAQEFFAKQLLDRWGVVFRDLVARETLAPPWRDLLAIYRRLEAQGEIRGGRFVSGFTGEQFARPEAVDLLRHLRRTESAEDVVDVALADPLNLTGIILPGARTSSATSGWLRYRNGSPELVEAITISPGAAIRG